MAREYGLPCVVNVPGATTVFKSGDLFCWPFFVFFRCSYLLAILGYPQLMVLVYNS